MLALITLLSKIKHKWGFLLASQENRNFLNYENSKFYIYIYIIFLFVLLVFAKEFHIVQTDLK